MNNTLIQDPDWMHLEKTSTYLLGESPARLCLEKNRKNRPVEENGELQQRFA